MSTEPAVSDESRGEIKERHCEARDELIPDEPTLNYIGGKFVESASDETFETRDPTTGEVLSEVQAGNSEDINHDSIPV